MQQKSTPNPLKGMTSYVLACGLSLAACLALLLPPKWRQQEQLQRQGLELSLEQASHNLAADLFNNNRLNMQAQLQPLVEHPWVAAIQILSQEQSVLVQVGKPLDSDWLSRNIVHQQSTLGTLRLQLDPMLNERLLELGLNLLALLLFSLAISALLARRLTLSLRQRRSRLLGPLQGHFSPEFYDRLLHQDNLEPLRDDWLSALKLAAMSKKHLPADDLLSLRRLLVQPSQAQRQGLYTVLLVRCAQAEALQQAVAQLAPLYDAYICPLSGQVIFGLDCSAEEAVWSSLCFSRVLADIFGQQDWSMALDIDQGQLLPEKFSGMPVWRLQGSFERRLPWFIDCAPLNSIVVSERLFNHIDNERLECELLRDLTLPDASHELWLLEAIKAPYNSLLRRQADQIRACLVH